jgi:ATP-binding cassette subfamily B multidrug efflux pump
LKQLLKFLEKHKKESILAPLFKMLEAMFDLFVPIVMADIINVGIADRDPAYITSKAILLVVLGLIGLVCSITAQYFSAKASVEACADIRHRLFEKIHQLGFSEKDRIGTSTLITRMTSDVNQIQNGLNLFLRLFLRSPFVVFGSVIMAFTIDVKTAIIFAVTIPVLSVVIFGIMLKTMPMYKNLQTRLDKLTGITRENLTGVRVVRAFGKEEDEIGRFSSSNSQLTSAQLYVGRISALMNPLSYVIINIGIAVLIWFGAIRVDTGILSAGSIVALLNYMGQILTELIKLANLIIQITKASACAERVNNILSMEPEMRFGELKADPSADETAVAFNNVSIKYSSEGEESLSDISFKVKRGQTVGIIGGTGSGKSTLINLIPRFYDVTSGNVSVYGHDVRDYDKNSLRKSISTVMQKAQLFSGTIRSNLLWGNEDADDNDLWKALDTAQASEIVRGKNKGLDEPVEQGGRNFSGGQKQRLSIARALVSNPSILILDDSASALDYATDAALRTAISHLNKDMTVFIVSQRTSSISMADIILVLDEGKLVGCGTHSELLSTCSVYKDIYDSQFRKADVSSNGGEHI